MTGEENPEEPKETNVYLQYLRTLRNTTIPNARDAVYGGAASNPGSDIKTLIDDDGWVCDKATEWTTELMTHTGKILPAFDDAISDIEAEISAEEGRFPGDGHRVPAGHAHGLAYQSFVTSHSRPPNSYGGQ